MNAELCLLSATKLRALIRAKDITAREVLDAHIHRVEAHNPEINAFVSTQFESARAMADELDTEAAAGSWRGPLHGLPYVAKDNFDVAGVATTFGNPNFVDNIATADQAHIARVRAAGAIILGKTNLPEFALGGQTTNALAGTTRNPLDPSRTVGGSSGGSAAALAGGLAPLADGSDLAGSIRSPAAWTGTVGLRPSNDRMARFPPDQLIRNLHTPGPMARTTEDVRLLFNIMSGQTEMDGAADTQALPLRIAYHMTPGQCGTDREIQALIKSSLIRLEQMGHVLEEAFPSLENTMEIQQVYRSLNVFRTLDDFLSGREQDLGEEIRRTLDAGRSLCPGRIEDIELVNARNRVETERFFSRHDFIVCPTTAGQAFSAELAESAIEENWFPVMFSPALGLPSISLPAGWLPDEMPVGLQIVGPPGSDLRLLDLAQGFERSGQVDSPYE